MAKKLRRNISGLRNQNSTPTNNVQESKHSQDHSPETPPDDVTDSDVEWQPHMFLDSLKSNLQAEDLSDNESVKDGDDMEEWDSNEQDLRLGSAGLQAMMMKLSIHLGDDPRDEDWVPPKLRAKREKRLCERRGEVMKNHSKSRLINYY